MKKPNGYVIYQGPSELDGDPVVAIVTGFRIPSANAKTGASILQTWILRADVDPITATLTGADASVCGDCKHRGRLEGGGNPGRSCYANLTGVRNLWLAWQRGNYPVVPLLGLPLLTQGQGVRLGTYGDPAAVPIGVWEHLTLRAAWSLGYTRQWPSCHPGFKRLCMASVESEHERERAKEAGWRTFRVRSRFEPLAPYEVVCPASIEAGKVTTCDKCRACGGNEAKVRADIVIIAHGSPARRGSFEKRKEEAGDVQSRLDARSTS